MVQALIIEVTPIHLASAQAPTERLRWFTQGK